MRPNCGDCSVYRLPEQPNVISRNDCDVVACPFHNCFAISKVRLLESNRVDWVGGVRQEFGKRFSRKPKVGTLASWITDAVPAIVDVLLATFGLIVVGRAVLVVVVARRVHVGRIASDRHRRNGCKGGTGELQEVVVIERNRRCWVLHRPFVQKHADWFRAASWSEREFNVAVAFDAPEKAVSLAGSFAPRFIVDHCGDAAVS